MKLPALTKNVFPVSLIAGVAFIASLIDPPAAAVKLLRSDTLNLKQADSSEFSFTFGNAMPAETDLIRIPLKNTGRLFMIEAIIDNQKGNLIFDTGASGLVLNRTYFRKYMKLEGQVSNGITGAVNQIEQINVGKINIADLTYTGTTAALADLGHIENKRGVKVMGLIGFELFRDFEIIIDVNRNELQLHRIDQTGKRKSSFAKNFKSEHSQKIEVLRNILFLKASVGGKLLKFCFDTGAETNAINNHASKNVLNAVSIDRKSNLRGAGTATVEVLFGKIKDFKIGDHPLENMETIITNLDALSEAYGVQIDGMLGYNFISQGVICINFVKKQLDIQFVKKEQI
jgi:predicted aspartyl protease